jgi:hypothetical protein
MRARGASPPPLSNQSRAMSISSLPELKIKISLSMILQCVQNNNSLQHFQWRRQIWARQEDTLLGDVGTVGNGNNARK